MSNLEALIESWRAGDERAAEAIYNLHRERTFRLAFALLGDAGDAEEAAQDAMTYALLHIDQFDANRSKFSTWLHMITVSRSRDILRKRRIPTLSLGDWLSQRKTLPELTPEPERKAEISDTRNTVWQAVQKLSPMLREAIVLRHWGEQTYQEISDIVGCPIKTAQSRVRLAYQKLAQILAETEVRQTMEVT